MNEKQPNLDWTQNPQMIQQKENKYVANFKIFLLYTKTKYQNVPT